MLYRGARAVLFDEPTAVLSPAEVTSLLATLRSLAADGAAARGARVGGVVMHVGVVMAKYTFPSCGVGERGRLPPAVGRSAPV